MIYKFFRSCYCSQNNKATNYFYFFFVHSKVVCVLNYKVILVPCNELFSSKKKKKMRFQIPLCKSLQSCFILF